MDTTKLPAGQLSVVQELPEVSRLVFQEVKSEAAAMMMGHHHHQDSIVNILQTMKAEDEEEEMMEDGHSLSPLDYTVNNNNNNNQHNHSSSSSHNSDSLSPLNLVNNSGGRPKGVKRLMAALHSEEDGMSSSSFALDPTGKRMRNLVLLQDENGQHIIHQLSPPDGAGFSNGGGFNGFSHLATIRMSATGNELDFDSIAYLEDSVSSPPMESLLMKTESRDGVSGGGTAVKSKSASSSPGRMNNSNSTTLVGYQTKTVAGTVIPSSKTCNWVFENGQVCGKTFSKSYNLVVHMRMHEDIRPFACALCDQTFRQKAHLQRHETTHGIQSKNFYRNPASRRKKRAGDAAAVATAIMGGKLQATTTTAVAGGLLQLVNNNCGGGDLTDPYARRKLGGSSGQNNSEGEEFLEDEEDDLYVPNGCNGGSDAATIKRPAGRKYSDTEARGEDREPDSDGLSDLQRRDWSSGSDGVSAELTAAAALENNGHSSDGGHHRHAMMASTESSGTSKEEDRPDPLDLAARHGGGGDADNDDDTSTVASILNTVNSVPTLEQKLGSTYHQLQHHHHHHQQHGGNSAGSQQQHSTNSYTNTMATTTSNIDNVNNNSSSSRSGNTNLPVSPLTTTLAQHLPGAPIIATTAAASLNSILYTTLSSSAGSRMVLEGLVGGEEHSPEIQVGGA